MNEEFRKSAAVKFRGKLFTAPYHEDIVSDLRDAYPLARRRDFSFGEINKKGEWERYTGDVQTAAKNSYVGRL